MSKDYCELPSEAEQERVAAEGLTPADAAFSSAAEHSAKHSRRTFLFQLALGMNALVGAVLAIPLLGYLFSPFFHKDGSYDSWIPLAKLNDMPVGGTRLLHFLNPIRTDTDGETAKIPVWARRTTPANYEVFAINCAHLGCPVRWFEQSQLFLCPCHGGAYYATGEVAAGPPPRGLYKYDVRIDGDTVMIHGGELPTLRDVACAGSREKDLIQITRPNASSALGRQVIPSREAAGRDA